MSTYLCDTTLGYVPEEDLPSLYAGAAVFAYPSLYEGFGLPVLEAMASGVPVVTSNRSSLAEVAGDCAQMIEPEDRVARGLAWAKTFTWERCAEQTLAVYRRALGEAGPR